MVFKKLSVSFILVLLIAGCGGGGGGSSSTPPALALTPSSLNLSVETGESLSFTVRAVPQIVVSGTVYVVIYDNQGVITTNVSITPNGDGSYTAMLATSPTLTSGVHTGQIEVRLCPTSTCATQFPGSPVLLPYTITVATTLNLTTMSRMSGVPEWETYQGNAAHTGYVPASFNAANFTTRWRWFTTDANVAVSPPVTGGDAVFVTTTGAGSKMYAINENDKSVRWTHDFGSIFRVNNPAVSGNAVYVATTGHSDTAMWSFARDTGVQNFSTAFGSQWESYYAPTVLAGKVYTDCGSYGGLCKFDATAGGLDWMGWAAQYDLWSPAVDGTYAYSNAGGTLTAYNLATGTSAYSMVIPGGAIPYSMNSAPVLAGTNNVVVRGFTYGSSTLSSLNTGNQTTNWSVSGKFSVEPVVANGVVYAPNDRQLEARSLATGTVLWSIALPNAATDETGFYGNVVVTDSHVFFSSNQRTYAVTLATPRTVVWTYPKPGYLAVSGNGILYIATATVVPQSSDKGLTAINLK